jgi:CARDB
VKIHFSAGNPSFFAFLQNLLTQNYLLYLFNKDKLMKRLLYCIFLTGIHFGVFSQQVFLDENFNNGIPASYQIQNGGSTDLTWEVVPNYLEGNTARSLNGSQFLFCNGDPAGAGSTMDEFITTTPFNSSAATSLVLQFSQFYKDYTNTVTDTGFIEVYDGNDWIVVGTNTVTKGTWTNPVSTRINITAYKNFEMRIRFRFVGEWPWYWAIDNLKVFTPGQKDVGVQSVVAPLTDCNLGDNVTLKLKVANYGTQSQPDIPVKYSVNGGPPVTQTMSASIAANATRDITFTTPVSTTALGQFKLTMWTDHVGDQDHSNDTLKGFSFTRYLNSYPTVTFTGYEGTNLGEVFPGWRPMEPFQAGHGAVLLRKHFGVLKIKQPPKSIFLQMF